VEAVLYELEEADLLLTLVRGHLKQLEEFTLIRSEKTVEVKLLSLSGWLSQKFAGENDQLGKSIDLRLTHQDLADIMGTPRVTITQLVAQLEIQGVIERLLLGRIIFHEPDTRFYEI
jgi:CRP-like cAMP-binding protein